MTFKAGGDLNRKDQKPIWLAKERPTVQRVLKRGWETSSSVPSGSVRLSS